MLVERLNSDGGKGWDELEESARFAVLNGGNAIMESFEKCEALGDDYDTSLVADHEATFAIIDGLDGKLIESAKRYKFEYEYFGEEFEKLETGKIAGSEEGKILEVLERLGDRAEKVSKTYLDFSNNFGENHVSVLFDPLDGTNSFRLDLPLYFSAIAFFIGDRPRVGAIYVPSEKRVYSASLRDGKNCANVLDVDSNILKDLIDERKKMISRRGKQAVQISTQITRSNKEMRRRGLEKLETMPQKSTVYMFNGGQYSMSQVARGSIDYHTNNWTYGWDVSPGEVLVKAIGGKVRDIDGNEIDYRQKRVGVIAAGSEEIFEKIR